jgi:hypothetical protein
MVFQHTSKSFAALPSNSPVAAKHMLLYLAKLSHRGNFIVPRQILPVYQQFATLSLENHKLQMSLKSTRIFGLKNV